MRWPWGNSWEDSPLGKVLNFEVSAFLADEVPYQRKAQTGVFFACNRPICMKSSSYLLWPAFPKGQSCWSVPDGCSTIPATSSFLEGPQ